MVMGDTIIMPRANKMLEMIKSMAMASIIYEDDLAERRKLPFKHKKDEDIELLVACEKELQRDVSLISTFEKFTNLV